MKTLVVNGYHLKQKPFGIANIILCEINELAKRKCYQIIVLANKCIGEGVINAISKNVKLIINENLISDFKWLMFYLPGMVNKLNPDLYWAPSPLSPFFISKKIKKMVTIHDFVSIEYRNTMTLKGKLISSLLTRHSITTADYLCTVSEFTKTQIDRFFPKRKKNKIFVGGGPSPFFENFYDYNNDILNKVGIKKDFFLFTGTLEPRKNIKYMLKLFQEYRKTKDLQLVIVGAPGWGKTEISEIIEAPDYPKSDVVFTGYITNEELASLYHFAKCYLSTSFYEGLGLPQIESMMSGCPVVSPYNSAMIEVVDGAGICVSGWDYKDWIVAMNNAELNREDIIKRQKNRIDKYRWKNIVDGLLDYLN